MQRLNYIEYGTHYYRAPAPEPEEWEKDIDNIKKLGFDSLQIRMQWRWHERIKGQFKWDDSDRIFEICKQRGVRVIVQFMLETAPEWLFDEHDCHRVAPDGNPILPITEGAFYVGGWLPCFDHPAVRREAEKFIVEVIERYKRHESLLGWSVWNEPRNRPNGECACEESRKKYRKWLADRYGSIENLNNFLGKCWGCWDEIKPPPGMGDYAEMYMWKQWGMSSVTDRVKWMHRLVKARDPEHIAFSHVGNPSITQNVLNDGSDDFMVAREVDFYGMSYGCSNMKSWIFPSLKIDWMRSVSPYFWVYEIYPNHAQWIKEVDPADLNLWIWTSIGGGAKGIYYWQYKNERVGVESAGHGLVGLDDSQNERTEVAAEAALKIREHDDIFRNAIPAAADIAMVYDCRADLVASIEENLAFKSYYGVNCYKESLYGSYGMFARSNIPVNWISAHETEIDRINDYKAVYLPYAVIMNDSYAEKLKKFVENGGTLISEASLGLRTENTWVSRFMPGCGLESLFGCIEQKRVLLCPEDDSNEVTAGSIKLKAFKFISDLAVTTAKVIGTFQNGKPAVTVNEYGKGRAIYMGFHPGISYFHLIGGIKPNNVENISEYPKFALQLADNAGIMRPVKMEGVKGLVLSKELFKGEIRIIFLYNHTDTDEEIVVEGIDLSMAKELLGKCEIVNQLGRRRLKMPGMGVACLAI